MEVYFENLTDENAPLDKLAEDVSLLLQDAEALVKASGDNLSEASRVQLEATLGRIRTRGERLKQQAVAGAQATDRVIRRHPYQSMGLALGVGVLLGVLLRRK